MASRVASRQAMAPRVNPDDPWPVRSLSPLLRFWLVLTQDVNPVFPRGTLVRITSYVPMPDSPNEYPGQVPDDGTIPRRTAENVLYRFEKVDIIRSTTEVNSDDSDKSIKANQISLQKGGRPNLSLVYEKNQAVYIIDRVPALATNNFGVLEVPLGTRARVMQHTSRGGPKMMLATSQRHPGSMRYVLTFAVQSETRVPVPCRSPRGHGAFRLPQAEEMDRVRQLNAQPAAPRVVSLT
ncbi:hypothetical protein BV20DRAFT_958637 [Pilatotrama ljubarskyi]|nr:hypothetical protein BV20DRAFT_958637 [Pilatotrama ljubarskyi]